MFSLAENNSPIKSKLFNHYFFHIGYNIPYRENWNIVPSLLYKSVRPVYLQFDLNVKVWYRKMVWGAVSYRLQDAVAFVAGFTPNKRFEISYSYDLTTSKIQKYSTGVHEIVLGFRIVGKNEILCPEKFW